VLDRGRTLAEGTPAEIRRNLDVGTAYLGAESTRGRDA
jgi:ABC-type branched-subunit amino acid transport system ATPase component